MLIFCIIYDPLLLILYEFLYILLSFCYTNFAESHQCRIYFAYFLRSTILLYSLGVIFAIKISAELRDTKN